MDDVRIEGLIGGSIPYVSYLQDGKLRLDTNDSSYEIQLEEFISFSWRNNAYGYGAVNMNILRGAIKGRTLPQFMPYLAEFLNKVTLSELLNYTFRKERCGESINLVTSWDDL